MMMMKKKKKKREGGRTQLILISCRLDHHENQCQDPTTAQPQRNPNPTKTPTAAKPTEPRAHLDAGDLNSPTGTQPGDPAAEPHATQAQERQRPRRGRHTGSHTCFRAPRRSPETGPHMRARGLTGTDSGGQEETTRTSWIRTGRRDTQAT